MVFLNLCNLLKTIIDFFIIFADKYSILKNMSDQQAQGRARGRGRIVTQPIQPTGRDRPPIDPQGGGVSTYFLFFIKILGFTYLC